jgi:hypothetical protein
VVDCCCSKCHGPCAKYHRAAGTSLCIFQHLASVGLPFWMLVLWCNCDHGPDAKLIEWFSDLTKDCPQKSEKGVVRACDAVSSPP